MDDELRCPICGRGVVSDLSFDAGVVDARGAPKQAPESRQLTRFSCGHVVAGPPLATADPDDLDVEQRTSEETVARIDDAGD